jgi:hypothetical protein
MTFYNVISGILFLGACQAFLVSLGTAAVWPAAVLTLTILNESIITSELIERQASPIPYELKMKLVDFVGFGTLAWALLTLSPAANAFNVDVNGTLWGAGRPPVFWSLLTIYWFVTLGWNYVAKQVDRSKWKDWFLPAMHLMWAPTMIAAYSSRGAHSFTAAPFWPAPVVFVCTLTYFLSKLWAAKP